MSVQRGMTSITVVLELTANKFTCQGSGSAECTVHAPLQQRPRASHLVRAVWRYNEAPRRGQRGNLATGRGRDIGIGVRQAARVQRRHHLLHVT